jgi:putative membrane protein
MMHGGYGMFGGGGILGIILIAIIAFFAIKYFNENNNNSNTFSQKNNALDVLNERYAKGEIDEEEYNRKKKILKD